MLTLCFHGHKTCCMKHDAFISIWGSKAALARAIGEGETTVRAWFNDHHSIPPRHDAKIIEAARCAGRPITHEDLFNLRQELFAVAEAKKARRGAA